MKKLLFAIILSFILVSCNNTENPTIANTGSTDGTGTENISNSGTVEQNIQENNSGTIEDSTGAVSLSSDLKKVFDGVNTILGTSDSDIQKTAFDWNIYDGEYINSTKIDGYSVSVEKINYETYLGKNDEIWNYFVDWKRDMYNLAGGPGAHVEGVFSGSIYCVILLGASDYMGDTYISSEEDREKFDYYITLQCSDIEGKKLKELDGKFLFTAWGIEPMWDYEINYDEISITTFNESDYEQDTEVKKISFEKVLENYYFSGENISGEIIKEYCLGDGAGFTYDYSTIINYKGTTYKGCVEKIPYLAEGDDFFEYGKSGEIAEIKEKTNIDDIIFKNLEGCNYEVSAIYKNFVTFDIECLGVNDYYFTHFVLQKVGNSWEKVWSGLDTAGDIDYDSCKAAEARDSYIWNWGPFRNCSESMPRG